MGWWRRRRPAPPSIYDRVTVRIYSHGTMLVGPLTLSELARIARYADQQGERSIINMQHLGDAADVVELILPFDVTMETR